MRFWKKWFRRKATISYDFAQFKERVINFRDEMASIFSKVADEIIEYTSKLEQEKDEMRSSSKAYRDKYYALVQNLLSCLDNFEVMLERSLKIYETCAQAQSQLGEQGLAGKKLFALNEGGETEINPRPIGFIIKKIFQVLDESCITEIRVQEGVDIFDSRRHKVADKQDSTLPQGTIIKVFLKGYETLDENETVVVRLAEVIVSSGVGVEKSSEAPMADEETVDGEREKKNVENRN